MNQKKIYIFSCVLGIALNFFLQTFTYYSLTDSSELYNLITTVTYSSLFFAIKILTFSLTYLLLNKNFIHDTKKYNIIFTTMSPLLLAIFYYLIIIAYQIKCLRYDINLSFINFFPHFLIQIFTFLLLSIGTTIYIIRKRNRLQEM